MNTNQLQPPPTGSSWPPDQDLLDRCLGGFAGASIWIGNAVQMQLRFEADMAKTESEWEQAKIKYDIEKDRIQSKLNSKLQYYYGFCQGPLGDAIQEDINAIEAKNLDTRGMYVATEPGVKEQLKNLRTEMENYKASLAEGQQYCYDKATKAAAARRWKLTKMREKIYDLLKRIPHAHSQLSKRVNALVGLASVIGGVLIPDVVKNLCVDPYGYQSNSVSLDLQSLLTALEDN